MNINGKKLCIGCMHLLGKDGKCGYCHLEQNTYKPIPRCLLPGTELAERYVLGRVLGEGSFGITYVGWDSLLEIAVAIKEYYPSDLVSRDVIRGTDKNVYIYEKEEKGEYQEKLDKFLNEARCLTKFNQMDGVVSVRDFFYENNTAYIVMEYVEGCSLKEFVQENGALSGEDVLCLMKPVLEALTKIHKTGLVHRDISPDNLLFNRDGKLVLIDFGAARVRNVEMTRSMTVVFKRGFSPEEQYRSRGRQGAWSDVYAICATMYYMLMGRAPEEAIERMIGAGMPSLMEISEIDLTQQQKKAIMKGISVRAEERYPNIEQLCEDLYNGKKQELQNKEISQNKEITQNKKSYQNRETSAMKKKKYLFAGVGMCTLVMVLLLGFFWMPRGAKQILISSNENVWTTAATVLNTTSPSPIPTKTPVVYQMISCKNMTKQKAEKELNKIQDSSLTITWKRKYSDTVKSGRVIRQSIKQGTSWYSGEKKHITLYISKGKQTVSVPVLQNLDYQTAKTKLKAKQLEYEIKWVKDSTAKGTVLNQSISSGEKVALHTSIRLTVSSGANKKKKTSQKTSDGKDDFAGVIS